MTDREKVMRDLEYLISFGGASQQSMVMQIATEALVLMKEQPETVRCKDCKKRETMYCPFYWRYKGTKYDDWFCADGVAKGINVPGKEGR